MKQKKNEVFLISVPYTVVEPLAMMIHLKNTFFASRTVVSSWRLPYFAFLAPLSKKFIVDNRQLCGGFMNGDPSSGSQRSLEIGPCSKYSENWNEIVNHIRVLLRLGKIFWAVIVGGIKRKSYESQCGSKEVVTKLCTCFFIFKLFILRVSRCTWVLVWCRRISLDDLILIHITF